MSKVVATHALSANMVLCAVLCFGRAGRLTEAEQWFREGFSMLHKSSGIAEVCVHVCMCACETTISEGMLCLPWGT
jgi:hypothetical protein